MSIGSRIVKKVFTQGRLTCIRIFHKNISIGKNVNYRGKLIINCPRTGRIIIGDGVFFNNYCSINAKQSIEIGENCILGESVKIYDHNHKFSQKDTPIKDQGYSIKSVSIGSNCWIGSNTVVLAGTSIGDNAVIAAGCTIKGDIPANVVVRQGNDLTFEPIILRGN